MHSALLRLRDLSKPHQGNKTACIFCNGEIPGENFDKIFSEIEAAINRAILNGFGKFIVVLAGPNNVLPILKLENWAIDLEIAHPWGDYLLDQSNARKCTYNRLAKMATSITIVKEEKPTVIDEIVNTIDKCYQQSIMSSDAVIAICPTWYGHHGRAIKFAKANKKPILVINKLGKSNWL